MVPNLWEIRTILRRIFQGGAVTKSVTARTGRMCKTLPAGTLSRSQQLITYGTPACTGSICQDNNMSGHVPRGRQSVGRQGLCRHYTSCDTVELCHICQHAMPIWGVDGKVSAEKVSYLTIWGVWQWLQMTCPRSLWNVFSRTTDFLSNFNRWTSPNP